MTLDNQTRPTGEQLRFRSAATGDWILDAYLEACELGGRTVFDLLSDLFGDDGNFREELFQFRINSTTRALEFRIGVFIDPTTGWLTIPNSYILRQRGAHATATAYEQLDVVTSSNSTYICTTAHTSSSSTPDLTKFSVVLDGTALNTATAAAAASATAAAASATSSASSASAAATSATASANSATASATSATNSASSASAAATSASNAATAQAAAELAYDNFDDRYLGAKATDPTVDNDGNSLLTGALHFNTTASEMRVYTGTVWVSTSGGGSLPLAGGTMTGNIVLAGDATANLHPTTKQQVDAALALKAPLASPALTGTPTAPTATAGTNSTQIATTAFVLGQGFLTTSSASATFLTQANAASTYLTQSSAASTYLTSATAASTYLTSASAASTYLTQTNAASTYLTQTDAASTYLTQTNAASTYATQTALSSVSNGSVSKDSSTGAAAMPAGTTAQRPASPFAGQLRYNSTTSKFEGYTSAWGDIGGGGATGGGSDAIFNLNDQTVTTSYSIPAGKNAGTFGPITIPAGVTVTVPAGSTWSIV